jgi:hypothetical protein
MTATIDKIDPRKGYTKDNCRVICWWYNCAKQQHTDEVMLNMCKAVINKLG